MESLGHVLKEVCWDYAEKQFNAVTKGVAFGESVIQVYLHLPSDPAGELVAEFCPYIQKQEKGQVIIVSIEWRYIIFIQKPVLLFFFKVLGLSENCVVKLRPGIAFVRIFFGFSLVLLDIGEHRC